MHVCSAKVRHKGHMVPPSYHEHSMPLFRGLHGLYCYCGSDACTACLPPHAAGKCQLQLALFTEEQAADNPDAAYPINALRNRGIQLAATEARTRRPCRTLHATAPSWVEALPTSGTVLCAPCNSVQQLAMLLPSVRAWPLSTLGP